MNVDPNGTDWESFWRDVGGWFVDTFGGFVDVSYDIVTFARDFLFGGFESGTKIVGTIGNSSKPISFYISAASERWKFWEYQVGLKINFGDFNASLSVGLGELKGSVGWENTNFDLQVGVNKIGVGISHIRNRISTYSQVYIRPVPVALLVAAVTVGYPVGTPLS